MWAGASSSNRARCDNKRLSMNAPQIAPQLEWVRDCYNALAVVQPSVDPYHVHTHRELERFVWEQSEALRSPKTGRLLNVGSGGKDLGIDHPRHFHVDLAENSLSKVSNAVAADVQQLPFADHTFDHVMCIGCVLNYCDAVRAIAELSRVLKPGGSLIIDWERSHSWEFIGTPTFSSNVHPIKTFYSGTTQYLWVYSDSYVQSALRASGFEVRRRHSFHLASQAVLRLVNSPRAAAWLCFLDPVLRRSRLLRSMAGHIIVLCSKTSGTAEVD